MIKLMKAGIISVAAALAITGCTSSNDTEQSESGAAATVEGSWIGSKNTTRINTSDPATAAVIVSQSLWMATSDDNRPGGVILANPDDWQSTLASADLIHHPNNGPVLFVNKDGIPEVTLNELKRLKPTGVDMNDGIQAILVGDLDEKVEVEIKGLGLKTDHIKGDNPAAAAQAIDAYYTKVAKENPASVIVGSMESEAYTLPAVNWIAHMPEPLLYVKKDEIPVETVEALKTRGGKANIYILGPESVISVNVEEQLGQYGKAVRIAGKDPYENAVAFAQYKDPVTGFGWGITTPGHNFSFVSEDTHALALAAAPFSHLGKHAPLLLTEEDQMPESLRNYVMSIQPKYKMSPTEGPYNHAWITGGRDAISIAAQGEIDSMLEIVSESGTGHGSHGGGGSTDAETEPVPGEEGGHDMSDMPGMNH
ncbi:cell wall-binding repeat-containing protein [Paenibacillus spongiae]|uniref:Cell wall-binding repeat-containing protein n=1 Tax=Paenibacillus spongiae TaxID=2909671 RepID=A0ABY5S6Q6_9BACL|nr:cell wall-binding repeat-containing protein [Paenibacillus spongiae]UVI28510.1 cell wall-binding repeat-containing protein [Paenibacillus spongiae]